MFGLFATNDWWASERLLAGLVLAFVGWLLGVLTQSAASAMKVWVRGPRLAVTFDTLEDCQTLTPEETDITPANEIRRVIQKRIVFFARLRVRNDKPRIAKECRGYLVKVERKDPKDGWVNTLYSDSMPLMWSYDAESASVEIPNGVTRYIDVVRIQSDLPGYVPQIRSASGAVVSPIYRYAPIFKQNGTFRFTILVSAHDIKPRMRTVTMTWDSNWPPKAF